ncbi:helix-turn-helix domain-containing protein [Anaerosinus massiliensis]|uniref:hypothetical protein n=1 Tax=Massilibacillus massiliensis TaxID=1806837 RepID=UPI000DA5EC21|nr:hypothetical protein [Massilibacillus massiliensis]
MNLKNSGDRNELFENHNEPLPFFSSYTYAFQDDCNLSLNAKGLLAMLVSFGKGWTIYMKDIVKRSNSKPHTLKTAVKELENAGYLTKSRVKKENGQYCGWSYTVYQKPTCENKKSNRHQKKPTSEKAEISKNALVKYKQNVNINKINNKQQQHNDDVVAKLEQHGVEKNKINEIVNDYPKEQIIENIFYGEKNKSGKSNMAGWIIYCIINNLQLNEFQKMEIDKQEKIRKKVTDSVGEPISKYDNRKINNYIAALNDQELNALIEQIKNKLKALDNNLTISMIDKNINDIRNPEENIIKNVIYKYIFD